MANQDNEKAIAARRKELLEVAEAEAALSNTAVMNYFESVRAEAVEAMLNPDFEADDLVLIRVRAVAQTVDKLLKYLEEKRDLRAFIEDEIKALEER